MSSEFERSVQQHLDSRVARNREIKEREDAEFLAYQHGVAEIQRGLKELTQFLSSRISPERYFIRKSGSWYKQGLYSPRGFILSRPYNYVYVLTADGRIWKADDRSGDPEYIALKLRPGSTWSYITTIGGWEFRVDDNGTVTASHYSSANESTAVISMQDALAGMAATAMEEYKKR